MNQNGQDKGCNQRKQTQIDSAFQQQIHFLQISCEVDPRQNDSDDTVAQYRVQINTVRMLCRMSMILLIYMEVGQRSLAKQWMCLYALDCGFPDITALGKILKNRSSLHQLWFQQYQQTGTANPRHGRGKISKAFIDQKHKRNGHNERNPCGSGAAQI